MSVRGAGLAVAMTLAQFTPADWERTLRVNLTSPMVLAHAAWPALRNFLTETWTWGYSGNQAFDIYNWWVDDTQAPLKS